MRIFIITITFCLSLFANECHRDNAQNIVICKDLIWQDDKNAKSLKLSWQEARQYCKNLELLGLKDWFLPTFKQLQSITDQKRLNPAINKIFKNTASNFYWAASYSPCHSDFATYVNFYNATGGSLGKSQKFNLRCAKLKQKAR